MSKLFNLIESGAIYAPDHHKIIRKDDFSTLLEAKEVLEKAQQDVDQFWEKTKIEAEELKQKGYDDGFAEGVVQLNEHLLALDGEKKRLYHEMNQLILPLALKAAKKIVSKELELHPDTIVSIVSQALTSAASNHFVTIYVNKNDKEILESEKPALKEKLEQLEILLIKERDDIAEGGCIIETESGIINSTIENQWKGIERAFERYVKP
ncbi:FliH/SctL family protein [Rhabdochlamydiaceae symbiont of Dictyostelium giganteum]|uniref:FliH/SctL family protein n=1 Tax=Rhabdochlamydiaceae symbiont of Dictyostelium giganteum TaxID=3342349 RepID=UPI00384C7213